MASYKYSSGGYLPEGKGRSADMMAGIFISYLLSILGGELVLRLATIRPFWGVGLLYVLLFSLSASALLSFVAASLKGRARGIFIGGTVLLLFLLYGSQLIYNRIFYTYYTVFSAANGGQVLQFWMETLTAVAHNWYFMIMLLVVPVMIITILAKGGFKYGVSKRLRLGVLVLGVMVYGASLLILNLTGREAMSPYDLYYKTQSIDYSMEKLGAITTMRLDATRLMFGFDGSSESEIPDGGDIIIGDFDPDGAPINPSGEQEPDEPDGPAPVVRVPNVINIDFDALIAAEKNETIADMHKYFSSLTPTMTNEMTGIMKGKNLIFITAEAFSHMAVDKDLTPTLYKMVHEGINFINFYTPVWGVSTSDGEYVACTGLIPKGGVWSFKKSGANLMPFVMGNQLKKLGYSTNAYHNHTYSYYGRDISHPNMGYDYKGYGSGLEVRKTWPESDIEMIQVTTPEYINNEKFHAYYMTVSGHLLYNFTGNFIAGKNRELVSHLPYSEAVRAYLACNIELDRAMELLLKQLSEAGKLDDTLIAISADHYPYGLTLEETSELLGHKVEENFELYKNAFILYNPTLEPRTVTRPCSSLDIIPTISNMLGLEFDSRLLMGVDMFSDADPLVIFSNRSFITDKVMYNAKTKEVTPLTAEPVDADYVSSISKSINKKFSYSAKILENDYYKKVLGD